MSQTHDQNDYNLEFIKQCKVQNVVPIPALARIENHVLSLIGYQLSDGLALALGNTLGKASEGSKS